MRDEALCISFKVLYSPLPEHAHADPAIVERRLTADGTFAHAHTRRPLDVFPGLDRDVWIEVVW